MKFIENKPVRYCKLSNEMLDNFLKSDCRDEKGWGKQMEAFAKRILNDLCFTEFFIGMPEHVFARWQKGTEEKKAVWIETCSIKEIFFLPQSVVNQLAQKDQNECKNPQGLIVLYDKTKCDTKYLMKELSKILHSDKEHIVAELVQLLVDLKNTIQFKAIKNFPGLRPGFAMCFVNFEISLKEQILKSFREIEGDVKDQVLEDSRKYIDMFHWDVIERIILPELFGNGALPANTRPVIELPIDLIEGYTEQNNEIQKKENQ